MAATVDPLIRFRPAEELAEFLNGLQESEMDFPPGLKKELLTVEDMKYIRLKCRRTANNGQDSFHRLVRKCEMILPSPKFPPRNPELEARVQRLRAEQANLEYKRMTENVDGSQGLGKQDADEPIGKQLKELNRYLFVVLQFIITVLCAYTFGYMAPYYFRGETLTGSRMLSGIMCGFVVAAADLYFVIKFLLESEGLIESGNIKIYDSQFAKKKKKTN